jgi:hypothetical protein
MSSHKIGRQYQGKDLRHDLQEEEGSEWFSNMNILETLKGEVNYKYIPVTEVRISADVARATL